MATPRQIPDNILDYSYEIQSRFMNAVVKEISTPSIRNFLDRSKEVDTNQWCQLVIGYMRTACESDIISEDTIVQRICMKIVETAESQFEDFLRLSPVSVKVFQTTFLFALELCLKNGWEARLSEEGNEETVKAHYTIIATNNLLLQKCVNEGNGLLPRPLMVVDVNFPEDTDKTKLDPDIACEMLEYHEKAGVIVVVESYTIEVVSESRDD